MGNRIMQPTILLAASPAMRKSRPLAPWLSRLLGKFALDVMPTVLASVIGTILLAHYGFYRPTSQPVAQAAPASAEMLDMVRDEHTLIMNYLQTQIAAERSRQAAEDADSANAMANAKVVEQKSAQIAAAATAAASSHSVVVAAAKPVHPKVAATSVVPMPVPAPLVIAQTEPQPPAARGDRLARDPDSLLAKTLDIKDHVVDHVVTVTQSVVSV